MPTLLLTTPPADARRCASGPSRGSPTITIRSPASGPDDAARGAAGKARGRHPFGK
ncbi:hypothetical protein AB5I41_10655 [Sphingomonas sp. MMS24-JH45]